MRDALHANVRTLGLFASLLLLQCGPKQPGDDGSSGSTLTTGETTTDTTTDTFSTSTTTAATTTGPTTTEPTTGGACASPMAGNIWNCQCTTNLGPWTPFNEGCGQQEAEVVEWAEWLCEEYADEEPTTGAGTTAGGDAGGTAGETAEDTDTPLGCKCTCRVSPECCDDSKP